MDIIDKTIRREGGFVDHPDDPGGATNMGITLATLSRFLGRPATVAEVRRLDRATARAIYRRFYMEAPRIGEIADEWLRELVFDAGVLFGPARPIRWLQRAAGVAADGVLGPVTLAAVNAADPGVLGRAVLADWVRYHGVRVQSGRSSPKFIAGWLSRATEHLLAMPAGRAAHA